jgi:hypothetical protein
LDSINVRYGETLTLYLETDDVSAVSADIFIGRPTEEYVLTKSIALTDSKGTFEFSNTETMIPLGAYYYQINVVDSEGRIEKYPAPAGCDEDDFPEFVVSESLDLMEIS